MKGNSQIRVSVIKTKQGKNQSAIQDHANQAPISLEEKKQGTKEVMS
jgi:hypothetical protein